MYLKRGKGMDLTRTFAKVLKEGTRQVPHRLPIAFGQLHGSKVPDGRARAKPMDPKGA